MVKDGVTIIIGGLKKDQRTKTVRKIPLIGDIPLLGFLFRSTSDDMDKTELVILLTPHIMSGETSYTDFSEIKPKEGAVAKMNKGNIIYEKFSSGTESQGINEYYKLVADKLKALALFAHPEGQKGDVDVSFTLDASGQLKGEPKIVSSTNANLDQIAIADIKKASPFPVFPKGLDKAEESFRITLEYR
jgi:TonB family protein